MITTTFPKLTVFPAQSTGMGGQTGGWESDPPPSGNA